MNHVPNKYWKQIRLFKAFAVNANVIFCQGPVQFTPNGDRMGFMKIKQLQGEYENVISAELLILSSLEG